MSNSGLLSPLRRRPFRHLAISYAVNEMGDWLGIVALSVLVFEATNSALATTLLFLGTGFLPALLTPLFVARLERPPPRYVLPLIYAAEAAAFTGLALLADNFSLAAIVAIAAVDGALALTAKSLTRGVTAAMLAPHDELRSGNAVLNVAFTWGAAAGPALGGAVVAGLGVRSALLLDAVSFYVIAWIVFLAGAMPEAEAEEEDTPLRERMSAGLTYIRSNVTLKRLIVAEALALTFFSLVVPIEVVYAKDSLGVGDVGYGVLLSSWGAGMVAGSVVFAVLRRASLPFLFFFSTFAIGASYLGMAAAPTLVVACVASVVGGTGNGVHWVVAVSAVQELTPQSMQVRTIGTLESIASAAPGISYVLGGVIASAWDPRATFVVAGAGVLVVVAAAVPLLGYKWLDRPANGDSKSLDGGNDVVLELLPGGRPVQSDSEVLT